MLGEHPVAVDRSGFFAHKGGGCLKLGALGIAGYEDNQPDDRRYYERYAT